MGQSRCLLSSSILIAIAVTSTLAIPLTVQRFKEVGNGPSTKSNEFYIGFLPNDQNTATQRLLLTITTEEPQSFNVTVSSASITLRNVTVPAYGSVSVSLDLGLLPNKDANTPAAYDVEANKGVYVAAPKNRKISVYGFNAAYASMDSFVAAPAPTYSFLSGTSSFPYEYYVFSADTIGQPNWPGVMVVAGQNSTEVVYIISTNYISGSLYAPSKYRGYATGTKTAQFVQPANNLYNYSMILNQRNTYFLKGETTDLTGLSIKSSKPISMFSGHSCGKVSVLDCDHVVEQVTPTVTWGKLFFSAPIFGRSGGDIYKVIAAVNNTVITVTTSDATGRNNYTIYNIFKGGVTVLDIPQNTFIAIESNKPIYVMQYQKGSGANVFASNLGDPYSATIPPVEQYLNSYVVSALDPKRFLFSSVTSLNQLYLAITVLEEFYDKDQIFVNNKTLDEAIPGTLNTGQWYKISCFNGVNPSVCGRGAIVTVPGPDIPQYVRHNNPKAGLMVTVMGLNEKTSFGHSAGYEVEALSEPAFSFEAQDYTFPEGNAARVVSVKVVKQDDLQLLRTVAVNVSVSFPSLLPADLDIAQLNVDFRYNTTYLTFGPNDVEKVVNFTIIGNQVPQRSRQFYFNLASTVLLSPYPTASITIADDDTSMEVPVGFNPVVYNISSDAGSVSLMVQRTGSILTDVSVTVTTRDQTAIAGQDYLSTTQSITFPASSSPSAVLSVPVSIISNNIAGQSKTFLANLTSSDQRVTFLNRQAVINIINNNVAVVQFSSSSYTVIENAGNVKVCLNKTLKTQQDFSVTFNPDEIIPRSAQVGVDFAGTSITATFPSADTQLCVFIPIRDNFIALEKDKVFHVTFSTQSIPGLQIGTSRDSNVTIIDDDVPTVTLTSNSYMTQKGQPAQVCVSKDLATASDISGVITAYPIVAPNAATPLVHFTNGSYAYTIPAGQSVACVNITTINDNIMTDSKVFNVSIGPFSPTGREVRVGNPSTAQVTIVDNNVVPFSFTSSTVSVAKDGKTTNVCLQKTSPSTQPISVTLYTTPLTATPNADYRPVVQTVTYLPIENLKCITIDIIDDGIALTGDKTFKVAFNTSSPILYPKGPVPESTVTIQDQSVVRVNFTTPITVVRQSQGPAVVCFVATPSAAVPISVTVTAGEDTVPSARDTRDFLAGSSVITIPANSPPQTTFCANVSIIDNKVAFLPNRTFTVTLQPPNTKVVVSPPCQVVIVDDHKITLTTTTPNGTYPTVPQVCFKSDLTVAVSTTVKVVAEINPGTSTSKQIITNIVFNPNTNVACADLSNYTEITTVIVKPVPDPLIIIPPVPGNDTAKIDLIKPTQPSALSNGTIVNDTVIGDPLYAVPLLLNISNPLDGPALCYEVHGAANKSFNLVSDICTSVNAYYSSAITTDADHAVINVITVVGIVAIDSTGSCQLIQVNLDGCTASVNGVEIGTSYQQADVGVRKIGDRVRISVPNCGNPNLVSWVVCEQTLGVKMIRFVISRGLNLRPLSHGIIGQFWNIPISMVHYSGTLPPGYDSIDPLYIITVKPPHSPPRSFLGEQYSRTWDNSKKTCYYSGGAQGGRTGAATPDDSVIEGTYTDYITDDIFSTGFLYNQFQGCRAPVAVA